MQTAELAYEAIRVDAESIRNDEHKVLEIVDPGDVVRQGDVMVTCLGDAGLERAADWEGGRQVAPGNTQGSRHIVEGLCELFVVEESAAVKLLNRLVPETRGETQFLGPAICSAEAWTLTHPEHGDVTFPAGSYLVTYQGVYARELRRAQD